MFWIGFACGIAAAIVLLFAVLLWATCSSDPLEDGEDEHADWGGIGAADTHNGRDI